MAGRNYSEQDLTYKQGTGAQRSNSTTDTWNQASKNASAGLQQSAMMDAVKQGSQSLGATGAGNSGNQSIINGMNSVSQAVKDLRQQSQNGQSPVSGGQYVGGGSMGNAINSWKQNAGNSGYQRSPEIDALVNAQKQAALAQLKSAIEKQVSGYNEQIAGLEPQYQQLRNQSEVERYKSNQAMRESLANSGEISGGQGRQDLLNLQNAYASRLNELNSQQQAQVDSLSRAIADARSQGDLQAAMLAAQYDAQAAELGLNDRYRYEDNLYRDRQTAFQNALAEAGITGKYNGQDTLAMQQYLTDKALAEGQLTGYYGGQNTLARDQYNQSVIDSDRNFALNEAGVTGTYNGQDTLAKQQADREFALSEGQLTGWYNGLPTTTQQQINIQFAQYQQSTGQQKRDNALQLLQMGMYDPQIAADAGMDDATAQYIANYARQTMQNDLTSQGLANQQAQADIANTQANTNRLNSNFSSSGGRGGSSGGSRGGSNGGNSGDDDDGNPYKEDETGEQEFSSDKVRRYYETYSGTTHNNLASPGQTVDAIEYLVSKGELTNAEAVELLNALGLAGMLEVREKQNR